MKIERLAYKDMDGITVYPDSVVLLEGLGIKGDIKAMGGKRQLSILPKIVRNGIDFKEFTGLCVRRYRENITWSGEGDFIKGKKYSIGEAVIQISELTKECFPECENIIENLPCPLLYSAAYAEILNGGTIAVGDEILPL